MSRNLLPTRQTQASSLDSLWVLGAASLVLHVVAFILPFPLWRYVEDAPSKSWAGLVDHSLLAGIGQALAWLLLFVLYWRAVGLARSQPWRQARAPVLTTATVTGLLLAVGAYPGGAIDVYSYVAHTRVFLSGLNPFLAAPDATPAATLAPFLGQWRDLPSPYGPLWELVALVPGWAGRGVLWREVVAFKLWNLAALLALLAPLHAALRARAPQNVAAGIVLVAWNPMLLVETAANGHNDTWMLLALAGAAWAWATGRWLALPPLLAAGIAIKWVPAIVAPLFALAQLRSPQGRRALPAATLLAVAVLALSLAPFWTTPADLWRWPVVREGQQISFSLQALVLVAAPWKHVAGADALDWPQLIRTAGRALFVLGLLWSGLQVLRRRWSLPVAIFWVLVVYLTAGAATWRPWYTIWPLLPAALAAEPRLEGRAALLTLGTSLAVIFYAFAWNWFDPGRTVWLYAIGVSLSIGGAWLPLSIIAGLYGPVSKAPQRGAPTLTQE